MHDFVFDYLGIADAMENKLAFRGSRLDDDVAEADKRLDNAVRMDRNVLHAFGVKLGDFPAEKRALLVLDDAPVGHDDRIEAVHCQKVEKESPKEEIKEGSGEEKEGSEAERGDLRRKINPQYDRYEREEPKKAGRKQNREIVPAQKEHDNLVRLLAVEARG